MIPRKYKKCRKCDKRKLLNKFGRNKRKSDGYEIYCKTCVIRINRSYYKRRGQKQRKREVERAGEYKRLYGISIEEYDKLHRQQNGLCVICHKPEIWHFKKLSIDHDHKTGKIRGLLCQRCNTLLGMSEDSADRLRAAASYLDDKNSI